MFSSVIRMLMILLAGLFFIAGVMLSPAGQTFHVTHLSAAAEETFTVSDLIEMGKSRTMIAAVSHMMTIAADEFGTPVFALDEVKNIVDDATTDDIRTALLAATSSHANANSNKITETRTKIANFAMTHNPAITCASPDTVGGHGRDTCVTACQHTHVVPAWTPRKASCYVLCTLATAPCDTEPFSWAATTKDGIATTIKWTTRSIEMVWLGTQELWAVTSAWMKCAFFLLVWFRMWDHFHAKSRQARIHAQEIENTLRLEKRDMRALKIRHVAEARSRNLKAQALHQLHDHFAMASYHDSDEGRHKRASLQLLVGLFARRDKRVSGERFVRWRTTTTR